MDYIYSYRPYTNVKLNIVNLIHLYIIYIFMFSHSV